MLLCKLEIITLLFLEVCAKLFTHVSRNITEERVQDFTSFI